MNKKLIFSVTLGEIYEIDEDEIILLDRRQIPLLEKPRSSCKRCYGRFYESYTPAECVYNICTKCGKECIDMELIKYLQEKRNG